MQKKCVEIVFLKKFYLLKQNKISTNFFLCPLENLTAVACLRFQNSMSKINWGSNNVKFLKFTQFLNKIYNHPSALNRH